MSIFALNLRFDIEENGGKNKLSEIQHQPTPIITRKIR